jgi:GT2 family glycosyltransferase
MTLPIPSRTDLKKLLSNGSWSLKFIWSTNASATAGPAVARNTGAARARGQYLVFTDDDCLPAPDWLRVISARFNRTPDCLIGGRIVNALSKNPYSTGCQLILDYIYAHHNRDINHASFLASSNLAVSTGHFHAIGGFNESFALAAGEDREFCDRWLRQGYRMTYAPEIVVHYNHAFTLRAYWSQQFNYGRGAFCFRQMRTLHEQKDIRLESPKFYLRLLCHPFSQGWRGRGPILAALVLVSQCAIASGFLRERVSNHRNILLLRRTH